MIKKVIFIGFKSFADKVEVEFSDGITAVIGPNGCGKSNIFDGIRWVLGEQSAKSLRGGKMDDVIFAGSSTRKPRETAEVTLVLDNSAGMFKRVEKDEVSVTRRAIRGKGSEYLIDGEVARLKDVHDLFLDSGVGSNSYSIIGQGQIERILSTKVDERRAIFEEAAGIVKLKHQKEQTEKRLKEVDTNLIRIEDILKEIEKQLKPLRDQSVKAKAFKELSDELQTIETQYLIHEFDNIDEKIIESNTEVNALEEKLVSVTDTLNENESELQNSKEIYQEKNDEIFQKQEDFSTLKEEAEKVNGVLSLTIERIENSKRQIGEFDDTLKEIEEKYSVSTVDFKNKQQRLDDISTKLLEKNQTVKDITSKINNFENEKMTLSTNIEFSRNKSIAEYNELSQEKYELEQLQVKEKEAEDTLSGFSQKMDTAIKEKTESDFELERFEKETKKMSDDFSVLQENFSIKQETLKTLKSTRESLIKEVQLIETDLIRGKSQLENLENFIENNENFFEGVKAILNAKKEGKFAGVHGAVAELITLDKRFEIAFESILQSATQFLVTENDTVAKDAVNYLKKEKLGRATFLPLNLANESTLSAEEIKAAKNTDGIFLAIENVTYDAKFEPIVKSLLGRSFIAENLDIALEFIKKHKIRGKVATIEGEIVQSGSISGGQSKRQKTSFFTKRRELDEVKLNVENLSSLFEKKKAEREVNEINLEEIEKEVTTLSEQVEKARNELNDKNHSFDELSRKVNFHTERIQELEVQEKELKLSLGTVRKTLVNLRFGIKSKEKNHKELTDELEKLNKNLLENEKQTGVLKEEKTALLLEVSRLTEESKSLKEYLEDFSEDSGSVEDKIEKLYSRKTDEENKIIELSKDKESYQASSNELKDKLNVETSIIEKMRSDIQTLQNSIDALEKSIKEVRRDKEVTEKALHTKQVYLSRKETEKTNILTRLMEGYEIEEENISSLARIDIDLSQSKKEIDSIKRKIANLGSINHAAIEDCEKLEERYTSEKEQFDDVKGAKSDLMSLLSTVEEEMTKRFLENFNTIAEHFKKIFVDMFGGGKAELKLLEPKNPLDSAIEIIAQPPGKKPAAISQLSGGEKAFTAVSLIFAIISAKPSPFVILDEVDAPLDDANVARFAANLTKFAEKSQFIVVTHRMGTMRAAFSDGAKGNGNGALIGVTQRERGVTITFPYVLEDIEDKDKKTS